MVTRNDQHSIGNARGLTSWSSGPSRRQDIYDDGRSAGATRGLQNDSLHRHDHPDADCSKAVRTPDAPLLGVNSGSVGLLQKGSFPPTNAESSSLKLSDIVE